MRLVLALVVLLACLPRAQTKLLPPERALGHEVGADRRLASYTELVAYWQQLAAASDRMQLREIGTSGYGQTMWMAVISSPQNLRGVERLRRISATLASGRDDAGASLADDAIAALAEEGRAVVWIDAGLHATEAIAGQNILELVWRMVSRDDLETRRILDEVVLLACPVNPDGMEMVARAYAAAGRVGNLPVLYQRYCGHDNNRDHYAANTAETRAVARVFYHEWFPQIVYNHHQTAPRGTVIYTPPFRDPHNYFVDPLVVRGIEFVAANMNARFAWEGKAGVISRSGAPYSMWWNGGLRTTTCFHNMIGILTEVFGHPDPTELTQGLDRRLGSGDYPMPIGTRTWHARDTIEYLQTANYAILDTAARYRVQLLANFGRMAVNSIARGSRDHWTPTPKMVATAERAARAGTDADAAEPPTEDAGGEAGEPRRARQPDAASAAAAAVFEDPALRDARAYLLPADQPDGAALRRFLQSLRATGVEVWQARGTCTVADGASTEQIAPGTFVVRCDQAFRPHVLDMFEPQWHPDDLGKDGQPVRPYDSAGWTLAMQMGVRFERAFAAVEGDLRPVDEVVLPPREAPAADRLALPLGNGDAYRVANRVLRAGGQVARGEGRGADATLVVAADDSTRPLLERAARELGVAMTASTRGEGVTLRAARVGVFEPWGSSMDTGWTEWVLDHYEFPYERLYGTAVEAGDLAARFDVLVFATGLPSTSPAGDAQSRRQVGAADRASTREAAEKVLAAMPPFEDWSGQLERFTRISRDQGVPNLRAFVDAGGTLLVFGGQNQRAAKHFDLPVEVGLYRGEGKARRALSSRDFFIPGSLVALEAEAPGVPARIAAMFRRSDAISVLPDAGDRVRVLASYGARAELLSGWALGLEHLDGKAAVVECKVGRGRVVLYGVDVIYRGQPHASFKLVFDMLYAPRTV
ncbi:MAG: M14 family metallopeptidase [Planctomycetota bacterium]